MLHKDAMNQLNVSLQHSITTLAAHGWSHRRIARELDITARRWGDIYGWRVQNRPKCSPARNQTRRQNQPFRSPARTVIGVKTGHSAHRVFGGRAASLCVPLQAVIESAVQAGCRPNGFIRIWFVTTRSPAGYHSVQRFVRQLLQTQPVPFVRMEVATGMEAQVDFGQGAWVLVDGKRKRPHLFRIVLSHSRKGYSEVVWQQTTESFIRCLENAFRYFGGVPRTLILDYVPRHIIDVLFPARICAWLLGYLGKWAKEVVSGYIIFIEF
jgi:hypothetical protein